MDHKKVYNNYTKYTILVLYEHRCNEYSISEIIIYIEYLLFPYFVKDTKNTLNYKYNNLIKKYLKYFHSFSV